MKYLFVCLANMYRSPFAAKWAREYAASQGIQASFDSAGLFIDPEYGICNFLGEVRKTIPHSFAQQSKKIFLMDRYLTSEISQYSEKLVVLDIPDKFAPYAKEDPLLGSVTFDEALKIANNENGRFGPIVFSKLLEHKVPPHL